MRPIALLALIGLASATAAPAQGQSTGDAPSPAALRVYVGTYTDGASASQGIYLLELDTASGALTPKGLAAESASPSFLAIHPTRKYLYAVSEVGSFGGEKSGSVSAFAIDPKDGKLAPLGRESSRGTGPCFVTVDATGRDVLVANYGGGTVAVLPIGPDGKLGAATSTIQHRGSSVDAGRQSAPHAHSINLDAANRVAVAADLGLDKLLVYKFDPASGTLTPNAPPSVALKPGSGPRHFAFHPDGRHAYAINELTSTVSVFDYDAPRGALAESQTISTRPPGASRPGNSTAEVVVHPSGRFLYGSNRGDDALAIYAIDAGSGKLTPVGFQPTGGKTPRNFAIDPTGRFLLAANQDSDTVVVFRVDPESGRLRQVGGPAAVPKPVCIRFVPVGP